MALINTKKSVLFLNPGGATLPVPITGFVETKDAVLIVPEFTSTEINRVSGKLNTKDEIVDTCRTKTTFDVPHVMRTNAKDGVALDTVPEYGLLLQAAGFDEVIDTATPGEETVTYTNNSDTIKQSSMVAYLDGNKFEMTDSLACGMTMDLVIGETALLTNNFQGYMDSAIPTPEANPVVTLSDEKALVVSCADIVTFDGVCLPLERVSIKMNEEIQDLYTMGGACGLKSNFVADYAMTIDFDFYVDSATYDREALNIESGDFKEMIIKIGLDSTSTEVNGQSVVMTIPFTKTTTYSDAVDKDLLKRTTTARIFDDGVTPGLKIMTGWFN